MRVSRVNASDASYLAPGSSGKLSIIGFTFSESFTPGRSRSIVVGPYNLRGLVYIFDTTKFVTAGALRQSPKMGVLLTPVYA